VKKFDLPSVDLIIPAYNEQENIVALLAALPRDALRHVVVVDNGSLDRTAALARSCGATVLNEPRRGYGRACLAGLAWIKTLPLHPDMAAFIDADLSDDPALLPILCEPITESRADLVIGSRPNLADPEALGLAQRVGNAIACGLIQWLTGRRYRDLGPMRVIRWSSLERIGMQDTTWGWTVEMQYKAAVLRLPILEIDVPYRRRHAGVSKISGSVVGSVKAGCKIIATIVKLWWQMRKTGEG